MPFKKGQTKKGGRTLGTQNKLTKTVKETVLDVFNRLQDDPLNNLEAWAKNEPTEFYKIASKLIPSEVNANVEVIAPILPPFMKTNESQS